MEELLAQTGARIRGRNRADCPDCKRLRAVSFDEAKRVYHCHGAECTFSGGIATLRQRLGIRREWLSREEYIRQQRERERAQVAKERLAAAVHRRCFQLRDEVHGLTELQLKAHRSGANHPATWDALALVYSQRPRLLAELEIMENATVAELVRFLTADAEIRAAAVSRVISLHDAAGMFSEFAGAV
jgi:hypothetical protein